MTKPIEITHHQWDKLLEQLKKDHKPSTFLIRERMKEKLGFTAREYKDWDNSMDNWRKNCIMLDFYSEKKRTWFIMKYTDLIQVEKVNNDYL